MTDLFERFTRPHPSVKTDRGREEAKLLASLMIVLFPMFMISTTFLWQIDPQFIEVIRPSWPIGICLIVAAWYLARTPYYRLGTWICILNAVLLNLLSIQQAPDRNIRYLYFVIPLLLGGALLPNRYLWRLSVGCLGIASALHWYNQESHLASVETLVSLSIIILTTSIVLNYQHRQAEQRREQLSMRDLRHRALLQSAFGGLAIVRQGRIMDVSDGFADLLGYRPSGMIGHTLSEFIQRQPNDQGPSDDLAMHLDGRVLPIEVVSQDWTLDEVNEQILAIRDLTDDRGMQAQLHQTDRLSTMGQLAAGVAHEVNNPLSYVLGNLDLLTQSLQGNPKEIAMRAHHGAQRVARIVDDLRTFSRTGSSLVQRIHPSTSLTSAVNMIRHKLRNRGTLIEEYGRAPHIDGDETRLGQVCLNLLVNAIEALDPSQQERNHVLVQLGTSQHGNAVITVTDNGPGIEKSALPRIFEPFFTTKRDGTGLGLAISRSLVQELRGHMEVKSTPGVGTVFRVDFPATTLPASSINDAPLGRQQSMQRGIRPRVLVIDDEAEICQMIEEALPEYEIHIAHEVTTAEVLIADGRWDGVLCDLMLPGRSGIDFYRVIQDSQPELQERFALITGGAYTEKSHQFLLESNIPVLRKPFRISVLRELLSKLTEPTHQPVAPDR